MEENIAKKTIRKKRIPKDKIVIGIIVFLVLLMFISKQKKAEAPERQTNQYVTAETIFTEKLPHLIEFGSASCVPCKMMQPVLAELEKEYKGQMVVRFIDVYENLSIAEQYSIRAIPTQIFFDENGKEIARHTGFFPKDDILSQWKSLGFEFEKTVE